MEIVFLGTSCMVPTKERNHQSIFIRYLDEGILLDCGEGTQRQLKISGIKPTKITKILITHWHGDHVLGLPGLLQTLNASEYEKDLHIYGPRGTKKYFDHMFRAFSFKINFGHKIIEIEDTALEFKYITVTCKKLKHSVLTLGYRITENDKRRIKVKYVKQKGIPEGPLLGELQSNRSITWKGGTISPEDATYIVKGKSAAFILDTVPCNNNQVLADGADLLVCEASYTHNLLEKAKEYYHMTATQAAQLASKCNVGKLILTHFSQRYKTSEKILNEARTIFKDTIAAYDFMKLKI